VLVCLATGEALTAADGGRVQFSPNGQGFVSSVSGKRLYGAYGQPLSMGRHHKTRKERVAAVLQVCSHGRSHAPVRHALCTRST
jgi:hypothetical protein